MKGIFLTVLFFSCHQQYDSFTSEKVLKIFEKGTDATYHKAYYAENYLHFTLTKYNNAIYKTEVNYDEKNQVKSIEGFLIDSLYGHSFDFYENGNLKLYCYYTGNGTNCSFIRKYSPNGIREEEQGNPFVDYLKSNDSTFLFFSTVFYDDLNVEVSTQNKPSEKISLKKSLMQPMLLEGQILNSDSSFFLRINGIEVESKKQQIFTDTIKIK